MEATKRKSGEPLRKLMNDELAAIVGKHEQLVGILQEKYGIAKNEARHRVLDSGGTR